MHEGLSRRTSFTREHLHAFIEQGAIPLPAHQAIAHLQRPGERGFPLSFCQQRLWFLHELTPGVPVYTVPVVIDLRGPLAPAALAQSLQDLAARHDILRTTVVCVDGQPLQQIAPAVTLSLPVVDLQGLGEQTRSQALAELARAEGRHLFDLAAAPLVCLTLVRLEAAQHVLLLTMHHMITDGWSLDVFYRELLLLYAAQIEGRPANLPDLPLQYVDFALWQREQWEQGTLSAQLAYWRRQLADLPPVLAVPADRPYPATRSGQGARYSFLVPHASRAEMQALCQREKATLFMGMLSVFYTLLSRYTARTDLVVGTPIANRTRPELEPLLGAFVNTLVLRARLAGATTFLDVLRCVRGVCLEAYSRQEVPFEQLVDELQPQRVTSHSPLVQVLFAFRSLARSTLTRAGLTLQARATGNGTAKFDLMLEIQDAPDGCICECEYNTDIFTQASIARMAGHYQTLLASCVQHPQARLYALPLLTEQERAQLAGSPDPRAALSRADTSLHGLFAQQVARTPDAIAVVSEEQHLSYQELARRVGQLAAYLAARHIREESRVGVCLPRSVEMVVAILGILQAGAAFVPLDPAYPDDQLRFRIADAGIELVLSQEGDAERPAFAGTAVCLLDAQWPQIAAVCAQTAPRAGAGTADHLAYILYTSGSTGRPKGVMIPRRAICNHMEWVPEVLPLAPGDRVLLKTPLTFDASLLEFFGALLSGASLVLARPAGERDSRYLVRTVVEQQITLLQLVPSMLEAVLEEPEVGACQSLRFLVSGGEALPAALPAIARACGLRAALSNFYGPTEAAIDAMCHVVDLEAASTSTVPIGRPITGLAAYVLDAHLQLCPIGIPGELYLAGPGLARGYCARPDLTAERFLPDCCARLPGALMYRTGDLVRVLPTGALEYLGRLDAQVKFRGLRIELAEIDAALTRHPQVAGAVTQVCGEDARDRTLVACVVGAERRAPAEEDLRAYLARTLPAYLVPEAIVLLDAFPLLDNGKVDRRALLTLAGQRRRQEPEASLAPRTVVEEVVASIWADVLGLPRIGVRENFFASGGHSLLATRVASRISQALQVEVPLQDLFEYPTIEGLAARLGAERRAGRSFAPAALTPRPRDGALPLSFAQQRLWFLDRLGHGVVHHLPLAFQLEGPLTVATLARSLQEIVRRHEVLRTTFREQDGSPQQIIAASICLALPVVDLAALAPAAREAEVARLLDRHVQAPFDLARGPLLRACLLRLAPGAHVFLLTLHHIVADGWSLQILCQELTALTRACEAGEPASLPPLPVQYADVALWQRQRLQGPLLAEHLAYWTRCMAGELPTLALPLDHPRPPVPSARGERQSFVLPADVSRGLVALCRRAGVTLFMVLLAAYQVLLARYSGQEEVIVGIPAAYRPGPELEGLIGLFLNTLVLRVDLSGNPSVHELLQRVRRQALGAYAHQELPFERLVEELHLERDVRYNPLFQVAFALQNVPRADLRLPRVTVQAMETGYRAARFDLVLDMEDVGEGEERELQGSLEYNRDLFEPATIARMVSQFQVVLQAVAADPQTRIADLPLLTAAQWRTQVVTWNATAADYRHDLCLHRLIAAGADQWPDRVAISAADRQLTYGELERRANQLAHFLKRAGVGTEAPVGLYLQRVPEAIVGILGILKAGGVYLPLDPTYPQERLAFMLRDSQARVLLTSQALQASLPPVDGQMRTVLLDADWPLIARESPQRLPCASTGAHALYIVYTSGSTGRPKGVVALQQGLLNRCEWMWRRYPFAPGEVCCQKTPLSFVDSLWEIFGPLARGVRLVIMPDDALRVPAHLLEILRVQDVTRLVLVPSLLRLVLDAAADLAAVLPRLTLWVTSGEALATDLAQRFQRAAPHALLLNLYGPSETSADVTCYEMYAQTRWPAPSPPIGRPINNVRIYLLSQRLQPVPVGVIGEIYIAGHALARGYLQRPELTAGRFVPDPFARGARMYRSGDLARYLPDGAIEFLGRIDHQVKIRGQRLEPGEIEEVLRQHPGVRDCVVVAWGERAADLHLVAYVTLHQPQPRIAELRAYLADRLPVALLPTFFLHLPAMPLTPSGKIDRLALPAPERASFVEETPYTAPRNATETQLVGIWAEVLGVERVGIHENFFQIGGHSLLLTQVMARVQQAFGVEVSLRTLFEAPTIAAFAPVLLQTLLEQAGDETLEQFIAGLE